MEIKRIGVTTDFSDLSRLAFPVAASLARKFRGELCVVHQAGSKHWPPKGVAEAKTFFHLVEKDLSDFIAAEPSFDAIRVAPLLVRRGNIADFRDALDRESLDLVVIATHGHTGADSYLLGSFAEDVMSFAPCPALACRWMNLGKDQSVEFFPKRILVPHDFTSAFGAGIELAVAWAKMFEAKSCLLSVSDVDSRGYGLEIQGMGLLQKYRRKLEKEAETRLKEIVATEWRGLETEVVTTVGHPVHEILKQSKKFDADLIVMRGHGKTGLDQQWLGTVAKKVVRKAKCPVLVVRGHRARMTPPSEVSASADR